MNSVIEFSISVRWSINIINSVDKPNFRVSVIEDIPPADRLSSLEITDGLVPTQKILGVLWKADKDVFSFQAKTAEHCKTPTKRNVLSGIARLFDPLQLLAPFTVRAKILMQDLWAAGCDWDEAMREDLSI